MNTKTILTTLITAICITSCSINATLYPIKGPLSKKSPLPVLVARVNNVTSDSGSITLTMPDGEYCEGRWSVVAPKYSAVSSSSYSGVINSGLNTAFYQAHGTTISQGIKPGINKGQAMLTGNKGTVMEMVFLVGSGTASGYGAGKDNKGNSYKLLF